MTQQPLSHQAKALMHAAEDMDNAVAAKYGQNSKASLAALHTVACQFLLFCELEEAEMLERETVDRVN